MCCDVFYYRSLVGMPLLTELITDCCQSSLIGVVIDVPVLTHGRTPGDHRTNTYLTLLYIFTKINIPYKTVLKSGCIVKI